MGTNFGIGALVELMPTWQHLAVPTATRWIATMLKQPGLPLSLVAVAVMGALALSNASAQRAPQQDTPPQQRTMPQQGAAPQHGAAQQNAADDTVDLNFDACREIGRRFHVETAALPAPRSGPIVTGRSIPRPYAGQVPQVPPGFTATLFARGFDSPRRLL